MKNRFLTNTWMDLPPEYQNEEKQKVYEFLTNGSNIVVHYLIKNSFIDFLDIVFAHMDFYDFQYEIAKDWQENKFPLIVHSTKIGVTTMFALYALWYSIVHPNHNVGIMTPNFQSGMQIKNKIIEFMTSNFSYLFNAVDSNANEINFINGSGIHFVSPSTTNNILTFDMMICDQVQDYDPLYENALYRIMTIQCQGPLIIGGTPKERHGLFFSLVTAKRFYNEPVKQFDFNSNPKLVDWIDKNNIRNFYSDEEFKIYFECKFPDCF